MKSKLSVLAIAVLSIFTVMSPPLNAQQSVPEFGESRLLFSSVTVLPTRLMKHSANEYRIFFVEQNSAGNYPAKFNLDAITSSDGLTWDLNAIERDIISPAQTGHTFNYYGWEMKEDLGYRLWSSATSDWCISGTNVYLSTSTDGVPYTGQGMVLQNGDLPAYDSRNIDSPIVIKVGGTYHMYFSAWPGSDEGMPDYSFHQTIGHAVSVDGISWQKDASPVLERGPAGSPDSYQVGWPKVVYDNGLFEMFYDAYDGVQSSVGYAVSPDGVAWTKIGRIATLPDNVFASGVVKENGIYRIWYVLYDGSSIKQFRYAEASTITDSDGDGIPDAQDKCPNVNASGYDADGDGCIDSLDGLAQLIETLLDEAAIDKKLYKKLLKDDEKAVKSFEKDKICKAIKDVEKLKGDVINKQIDKKISNDDAMLIIEYSDNIIQVFLESLPEGEKCK